MVCLMQPCSSSSPKSFVANLDPVDHTEIESDSASPLHQFFQQISHVALAKSAMCSVIESCTEGHSNARLRFYIVGGP